jgi:hypothetical protein
MQYIRYGLSGQTHPPQKWEIAEYFENYWDPHL